MPPLAVRDCEYAEPRVAMGREVVVIWRGGKAGEMVMLRALVAVALELSVTCTVNAEAPVAVGVPPMVPSVPKDNPAGRAPLMADHENPPVPPVADSACW